MTTTNIGEIGDLSDSPLPHRKKGRPLSFDRERALRQAMLLFWQHGYESTSLNDLTSALGVTPSSIYTVFKDKKSLFLESVVLYTSGSVTTGSIIEQAPTAYDAAMGLLQASAIGFTGADTPTGCLLATSAISCSSAAADVQRKIADIRLGIEAQLREKIQQSVSLGHLPATADADALAAHTMAVIQGLSTLARDGAKRDKLQKVAETAMYAWPKNL